MSLRVAARLADQGVGRGWSTCAGWPPCRRPTWSARPTATGRVLIVDETRRSGGVGEGVLAALVDAGYVGAAAPGGVRVDSYIPLGDAAKHLLVSRRDDRGGCALPSGRLTPYLHKRSVRHLRDGARNVWTTALTAPPSVYRRTRGVRNDEEGIRQ